MRSISSLARYARTMMGVAVALALAGCGGASLVPGLGGSGGLGTPGTDTGNPDGAMVFTLRGINSGDFEAGELRVQSNFLGFTVQGIQEAGKPSRRVTRVATLRFTGLPVQGVTYVLNAHTDGDGTEPERHAVFQYAEQTASTTRLWNAVSGKIRIDRVTADHIRGTFEADAEPATSAATGDITVRKGEFVTKYEPESL